MEGLVKDLEGILLGLCLGLGIALIHNGLIVNKNRAKPTAITFIQEGKNYLVIYSGENGEKADTLMQDSTGAYIPIRQIEKWGQYTP